MVRWAGWALGALLVGALLGVLGGLLLRRPVPEVTSYVAPVSPEGHAVVGPHRAIVRVADQ